MGTRTGVKGQGLDPNCVGRVAALATARREAEGSFEIVVDGGIRADTVPALAAAGADGVVPGSLVFGHPDPAFAVRQIDALPTGVPVERLDAFWTAPPEPRPERGAAAGRGRT